MTQKDIDRLLAARKLVDDYRNLDKEHDLKAQCYAGLTAAKTDSLISVTDTKAEIQRIDDKRDAATKTMNDGLKELGFESYSDFAKFNHNLCFEAFKASIFLTSGKCDGCVGYKEEPPCKTLYKTGACLNVRPDELVSVENGWTSFFVNYCKWGKEGSLVCPDGHGFQVDWEKSTEFPFDIKWRA